MIVFIYFVALPLLVFCLFLSIHWQKSLLKMRPLIGHLILKLLFTMMLMNLYLTGVSNVSHVVRLSAVRVVLRLEGDAGGWRGGGEAEVGARDAGAAS